MKRFRKVGFTQLLAYSLVERAAGSFAMAAEITHFGSISYLVKRGGERLVILG